MSASKKQSNDGPSPNLNPRPRPTLSQVIKTCQGNPEIAAALAEIYRQADEQIAELDPSCPGCGTCCQFEKMGHLLYVSGIELAYLLETAPPLPAQAEIKLCPYQVSSSCKNRDGRPLGCRSYFCDKGLELPLQKIHEHFHWQVRNLHQKFQIDYYYCELTSSIHSLGSI